jgi:2,3-dihydro-2,3-dihydroxybenzoate dehydrogenase
MERSSISGKVALVSGAAQGIGAAVAAALAARGAWVAALDANAALLDTVVADLQSTGGRASAYPADVRDSAAVERAVGTVERELGPIGVLVNVAGVLRTGPVIDLTDEDWAAVFAVNTNGVFHLSRAVARRMVPRRAGCIVTVGSNAGGVARMHMAAYAASKAATAALTKCLGLELAEHGIRCNVVSPGSTDTAMQRAMWQDEDGGQLNIDGSLESYRVGIPLRKLAMPSDVAEAVVFLASDLASHITMHDLSVDGGATLGV